jgi:hypothetical protein
MSFFVNQDVFWLQVSVDDTYLQQANEKHRFKPFPNKLKIFNVK